MFTSNEEERCLQFCMMVTSKEEERCVQFYMMVRSKMEKGVYNFARWLLLRKNKSESSIV